ncbi:MAG: M56 family metallopeptidase, partial [Planctomycetota bacterium]|nr:M56 family metallopeptidase [Planctomycetota bacterium]
MNAFGALILGALARGAALAVVGLVLGVLIRRTRPVAGASTTLAALLALAPLTLCALSPWPHWWSVGEPEKPVAATLSVVTSPRANSSSANDPAGFDLNARLDPRDATTGVRADEPPGGFWDGFGAALRQILAASDDQVAERWDARAWVAVAFLIGLTLGMIRLALALRGVRRLRRDAVPILDAALASELKLLLEDAGASRSIAVEARESRALATAATVGGRRATLFLPTHWHDWTADERRVVLAHEVAHIVRGDYAAGVWAQVSLALQFVNPPAHLLASRLRLDQELAADALGAQLAGGRQAYLVTLARLALRLDDHSSRRLGPARA